MKSETIGGILGCGIWIFVIFFMDDLDDRNSTPVDDHMNFLVPDRQKMMNYEDDTATTKEICRGIKFLFSPSDIGKRLVWSVESYIPKNGMMHPELRIYIYAYYIRDLYMADFNFSKVKDIETYIKASNEGYLSWIQENSSISFEEYFYRYFVDEAKGGNYVFENHIRDARKYIKLVTTGVKRIQTYGEYDGKLIKPISADTTINTDDIREAIKKWSWTQHWSR